MEELKIYNQDKTKELFLEDLDLEKGYLEFKEDVIWHDRQEGQEEKGHYEVIKEYPNGGKDVEWIIDEPGKPYQSAWTETIHYQIYIPYTDLELEKQELKKKLEEVLNKLRDSDYQAIKYAEGWFSEEEYAPIKELRESYRVQVREYQKRIEEIDSQDAE